MTRARLLAAAGCVLALFLGRHLLPDFLLGFTITLGLSLAVVTFQITRIVRETGWHLARMTVAWST